MRKVLLVQRKFLILQNQENMLLTLLEFMKIPEIIIMKISAICMTLIAADVLMSHPFFTTVEN